MSGDEHREAGDVFSEVWGEALPGGAVCLLIWSPVKVGIITPYEGQRVESLGLWRLAEVSEAYICSVLQRQTCFSHKAT